MRNGLDRRARLWAGIGSAACGVAVLAAAFWVGGLGPAAEVARRRKLELLFYTEKRPSTFRGKANRMRRSQHPGAQGTVPRP